MKCVCVCVYVCGGGMDCAEETLDLMRILKMTCKLRKHLKLLY